MEASFTFRLLCFSTGYWNIIVHGRKHSYRLYTKLLNEAMRWASAIQGVIDSKVPIETPTQQLIRDIRVGGIMLIPKWAESSQITTGLTWSLLRMWQEMGLLSWGGGRGEMKPIWLQLNNQILCEFYFELAC